MKTYLVTGAAGFIGANYLKYILAKHDDIKVVVLDALTYAGNLGTIASDIDNERCFFVKGDICDQALADRLFAEYKFDYVVNFAAESHVDRSIENPQLFLQTNILGTQNLLDAARRAWVTGLIQLKRLASLQIITLCDMGHRNSILLRYPIPALQRLGYNRCGQRANLDKLRTRTYSPQHSIGIIAD